MGEWTNVAIWVLAAAVVFMSVGEAAGRRRHRGAVRLAAVERKLDLIIAHLGIAEPRPYLPQVIAELERGKKIHAIKAYRDATGVDLGEAKEAVERIARDRGLEA